MTFPKLPLPTFTVWVPAPSISIPDRLLPSLIPAASRPMVFSSIVTLAAPPATRMPLPMFPEIRLPSPSTGPPISDVAGAPLAPGSVALWGRRAAVGSRTNPVAEHVSAGRILAGDEEAGPALPEMTLPSPLRLPAVPPMVLFLACSPATRIPPSRLATAVVPRRSIPM